MTCQCEKMLQYQIVVFVALWLCIDAKVQPVDRVNTKDGGYENVLVAINENVPEHDYIIESLTVSEWLSNPSKK